MKCIQILLPVLLLAIPAFSQTSATGFKVLQKISLPGDGGWDCLAVDSDARRVYVTHDTMVQVLDADSYKLMGTIKGTFKAHGLALVPELGRGYVTSGGTGTITVFDLKTLKVLSTIIGQRDADAMLYEPTTGQVFSFNGDSKNATVLEAATGKLVKTLELGGAPEFAVADGKGNIFDNLEDKSEVIKIDPKTLKITQHWSLGPGKGPSGIAMDVKTDRLFIGCRNKWMVVMNATNGNIVQTLPIGDHVDGTAFDPASGTIFDSCGDGTLSVIHEDSPDKFSVMENAPTEPGARTLAFDAKTGHLFLPVARTEPPPTPTKDKPKPRRKILPGTFHLLVVGEKSGD